MRNRMKFFFFPTYDIIPGLGFGGKRPIVEERDGNNREKKKRQSESQVSDDSYYLLCFHIHTSMMIHTLHSKKQDSSSPPPPPPTPLILQYLSQRSVDRIRKQKKHENYASALFQKKKKAQGRSYRLYLISSCDSICSEIKKQHQCSVLISVAYVVQ